MNLNFIQNRNKRVRIYQNHLEVDNYSFRITETLNYGSPFGDVSARSIAQPLEQFMQLTNGDCYPQLGNLVFTATGNYRALDLYFPITQMLSELEIEGYYLLVQRITQHASFDLRLIGEGRVDMTTQMPFSITHFVPGHLAEIFFYRREILDRFLTTPRRIELYTNSAAYAQGGGIAGGVYNPQRGSIQLILKRLFEGFYGETAGVCPFLHEFGHMLDYFDSALGRMGQSKGLLPGLSPEDGTIFNPSARRLFISGKRLELEQYLSYYRGVAQETDRLPIGHPYVFQNDSEFIAGYFELFFRNPNYFAAQNRDLFSSFVELFSYNPRKAWKKDFPFYVHENRKFYLSGQQPLKPGLTMSSE